MKRTVISEQCYHGDKSWVFQYGTQTKRQNHQDTNERVSLTEEGKNNVLWKKDNI
jgi:hypothetical protein